MHYKAPDNSLHFLEDDSFAHLLPAGSVPITQEKYEALIAPTPEQIAERAAAQAKALQDAADAQAAREDAALATIAAMTPAQAAAYVENNVATLAEAKAVLKVMAKAICILARQI